MIIGQKTNIFILLFILAVLQVCYLSFSKPNSKYCFIFQRYILRKDPLSLEFWPPTMGQYKTWYRNGQIREEGEYKNGLSNGLFIEYYEDGKIRAIGHYLNGKKEGEHIVNINDKIYSKKNYSKDKVIGIAILNGNVLDKDQEKTTIDVENAGIGSP